MASKFATRFRPPFSKGLKCGPSLTDGSFEEECRVDRILYKYTHHLPLAEWQMKHTEGMFADCTQVPTDPAEAHDWSLRMESMFASLPAEIRREYGDNLHSFITAVNQDLGAVHKKCAELLEAHAEALNPEVAKIRRLARIVGDEINHKNNDTKEPVNEAKTPTPSGE